MRKLLIGTLAALAITVVLGIGLAFAGFSALRWYYGPTLPSVASIRDYHLSEPLRIYSEDNKLIGQFGAERRAPLKYDEIPEQLINAFLAAEDDRFFEHPGVDWRGLLRAAIKLAITGQKTQGGSTITMQLARNVFLSPERSYRRKIREILLSLEIEDELSKQEILELYLNQIFLGQRAYGVGAAAQVYFGHDISQLSLAQMATLAGLPKAPSRDNPVASPKRAKDRRHYVLGRMRDLGMISELDYQAADAEPMLVSDSAPQLDLEAGYVAEMVRSELYAKHGESIYTSGLNVTTTIDSHLQQAIENALRDGLNAYDERHGWRGPETRLPAELLQSGAKPGEDFIEFMSQLRVAGALVPAAVTQVAPDKIDLLTLDGPVALGPKDFDWARFTAKNVLKPGDVVRIRKVDDHWRLAQIPDVQGAMVSLDPHDGAIRALTGGYDFRLNKYNRATQAERQPGSGFKPFLYASAFEKGFTPASIFMDAPVVYSDESLEGEWKPENYGGDFKGPMRLREALVQSRNLVSIRLLQTIGIDYARGAISKFGLPIDQIPKDLTMSLGSGSFTPLEMARGYSTLANGGFVVNPYLIKEIRNENGDVTFTADPVVACRECPVLPEPAAPATPAPDSTDSNDSDASTATADQSASAADSVAAQMSPDGHKVGPRAADPSIIWLIDDVLHDVTVRGTGARASELGRRDLHGKTGTSNNETDAWFYGFTPNLVGVTWVGFDQPQPLGHGEVGGRAALPIWMDYMRIALKDQPQVVFDRPPGLVTVRIDPENGLLAPADSPNAITETVQADHIPAQEAPQTKEKPVGVDDLF